MADKPWKRAERVAAALFGGLRNPLSGSNSYHTSGDVIHPQLYVEVKHRKRQAVISLMRDTVAKAVKERKLPVMTVSEPNMKWSLVCIRSIDLVKLVTILHAQWADEPNLELIGDILSTSTEPDEGVSESMQAKTGLRRLPRRHS